MHANLVLYALDCRVQLSLLANLSATDLFVAEVYGLDSIACLLQDPQALD